MRMKIKRKLSIENKAFLLAFVLNQITMAVTVKGLGNSWDFYIYQFCNLLLYLPVFLLLNAGFSFRVAGCINIAFLFIISTTNEVVLALRGRPIHYIDIYSIKAAANVASNYRLPFNYIILLNIVFGIVLLLIHLCMDIGLKKAAKHTDEKWEDIEKKRRRRCLVLFPFSIVVWGILIIVKSLPAQEIFWQEDMYVYKYGLFYAWYSEYKNSEPVVPEGYSGEQAKAVLRGIMS